MEVKTGEGKLYLNSVLTWPRAGSSGSRSGRASDADPLWPSPQALFILHTVAIFARRRLDHFAVRPVFSA